MGVLNIFGIALHLFAIKRDTRSLVFVNALLLMMVVGCEKIDYIDFGKEIEGFLRSNSTIHKIFEKYNLENFTYVNYNKASIRNFQAIYKKDGSKDYIAVNLMRKNKEYTIRSITLISYNGSSNSNYERKLLYAKAKKQKP